MEFAIKFVLIFAVVYGIYMIFTAILAIVGHNELSSVGIDDRENPIIIPGQADTLEYYVRCALWTAAFEKKEIEIVINEADDDFLETEEIAKAICSAHKNIFYIRR